MSITPVSRQRPAYLGNVQVLRLIAALMVLLAHLIHETVDHRVAGMQGISDPSGVEWGTGVDVFFIVSGFVMYYLGCHQFGVHGYAGEFLRRRVVRVVPLYWLFTALMLLALWQVPQNIRHTDASPLTVAASLLFYPVARADGLVRPILGLGWTLEYEMFFYVCFAAALLLRKPFGPAALVLLFLSIVVSRYVFAINADAFRFWSSPVILEFLLGVLISHLYIRGVRVGAVAAGVLIAGSFWWMTHASEMMRFNRLIWAGMPAAVLVGGLTLGPMWKLRWLEVGGDSSYSLYLSHPFTLNALALWWGKAHLPPNAAAYVVVGMVVCVATGLAIYRFVEVPLLNLLRQPRSLLQRTALLEGQG
jgi:peptidoglycan/LPS O-acetylase OafA/YrhL